jgi:HPt (histidine-containing phosphotransfer) domain-containing protein
MTEQNELPKKSTQPEMSKSEEIDSLLADLWQRHLPTLHERLDILDRTASEAATGALAEPSRAGALSIAHKLSGNLGMFGYHHAGKIASDIELILRTPSPEGLLRLSALIIELRTTLASRL